MTGTHESSEIEEGRSAISDFLRRMSPYFPFRASRQTLTPAGLSPSFALSLSYANLAVFLAPQPPLLAFPPGPGRELGWRGKHKAIVDAWTVMREQANSSKSNEQMKKVKGKAKTGSVYAWALREVSEWVVDILVSTFGGLLIVGS